MEKPKYCSDVYSNVHHALCSALSGVNEARTAINRIDSILQSISEAVADVSELWNASNNALRRLPAEVLGQFFLPLRFSECVSASGVCRTWRAAALAEHALWTELQITYRRSDRSIVDTMLARSGSLPLSIIWFGPPDLDDEYWSLLVNNMARIESLSFHNDLTDVSVLNRPAPLLKSFIANQGTFSVPAEWGDGGAPQLDFLFLKNFTLANARRMPSVTSLIGTPLTPDEIDEHESLNESKLFELFPSILRLQLCDIWEDSYLPEGNLPSGIRFISLRCAPSTHYLQYGLWLSRWSGYPSECLDINDPADLGGPLEYFVRTNRNSFSMSIWIRPDVQYAAIKAQENGSKAHLKISMKTVYLTIPHFFGSAAPYFHALTHLACPVRQMFYIASDVQTLPTLTSLTITVRSPQDVTLLETLDVAPAIQLRAPQLDTLRFDTGNPDATPRLALWFAYTLPLKLRSWLLFDRSKLYSAVLRTLKCDVIYQENFSTEAVLQIAESRNIHFRMDIDGDLMA